MEQVLPINNFISSRAGIIAGIVIFAIATGVLGYFFLFVRQDNPDISSSDEMPRTFVIPENFFREIKKDREGSDPVTTPEVLDMNDILSYEKETSSSSGAYKKDRGKHSGDGSHNSRIMVQDGKGSYLSAEERVFRYKEGVTVFMDKEPSSHPDTKETRLSDQYDFAASVPGSSASYPTHLDRVITAFRFITATLYTEIKSDLASEKVLAVTDQDTVAEHGRKILIPKGTKILGRYQPLKRAGDTRIAIEWYRMLTPDGIQIVLPEQDMLAEVADRKGASGVTGEIDNKFFEKYGAALLFATINAGAQLSVDVHDEQQRAVAHAFTQPLSQVTVEALRESINIAPTVRIAQGEKILISPRYDLWFREPRERVVEVVASEQPTGVMPSGSLSGLDNDSVTENTISNNN